MKILEREFSCTNQIMHFISINTAYINTPSRIFIINLQYYFVMLDHEFESRDQQSSCSISQVPVSLCWYRPWPQPLGVGGGVTIATLSSLEMLPCCDHEVPSPHSQWAIIKLLQKNLFEINNCIHQDKSHEHNKKTRALQSTYPACTLRNLYIDLLLSAWL